MAQSVRTIYVDPSGSDSNPGTQASPKRTAQGALDGMRAARASNSKDHFVIQFAPGRYFISNTLRFISTDSGKAFGQPTVIRGGSGVFFDGSVQVTGWQLVSGTAASRLTAAARPNVFEASLPNFNAAPLNPGGMSVRGYPYETLQTWSTLVFNNQPMTIARHPNTGWFRVPTDHNGSNTTFRMTDAFPYTWQNTGDVWAHGFFGWDWSDTFERVGAFNSSNQTVQLATVPPHGIKGTQRYYLVNALEAVDSAGEFFIDKLQKKVYFYAPLAGYTDAQKIASLNAGAYLTAIDEDLVEVYNANDILFENITFQNGRRGAVTVRYGSRVDFRGCTFRRFNTNAVLVGGGTDHSFVSCDFYDLDESALVMHGGERISLTPSGHEVVNCWFRDFAKECLSYRPAVDLWGVGHRVSSCRIEEAPHTGLVFHGNNNVVEKTDFERLCLETIDASAVYVGRNPTFQGNKVYYNRFRDIKSYQIGTHSNFAVGVFMDDMACGTDVSMNLFYDVQIGVIIGGGRDNKVVNNYFFDSPKAVQVDARGTSWASNFWNAWNIPAMLNEVPIASMVWREAYPNLYRHQHDDPELPKRNDVTRNVNVGNLDWTTLHDGLIPATSTRKDYNVYINYNSVTLGNPGFYDMNGGNYEFGKMSMLAWLKVKTIYPDQIGLYLDQYRTWLP